jgi:RNA polymerase sigma-70 factor (ECF subfamily)
MLDLAKIFDEHAPGLYRFGLSLSRNDGDAADLVQFAFLQLAAKGHQIQDETKVKTWLYTTLRREFLSTLKKSRRLADQPIEDLELVLPTLPPTQAMALEIEELLAALRRLPLEYREPLTLFYLKELSYAEISEILEIPLGTVMSRLSRAKGKLRKELNHE